MRILKLENSGVTDEMLKHIARLDNLRALNLERCPVTDQGVKGLVLLKELTLVALCNTKVTPEGAAALQKALPTCKVEIAPLNYIPRTP